MSDGERRPVLSEFERQVRAREEAIRGLSREQLFIFDPDGTLVFETQGLDDAVYFPGPVARGRMVVHNHPDGTSLSRSDVRVLLELRIAEMRVVTYEYRYLLRLPDRDGWDAIHHRVSELYYDEGEALADAMRIGSVTGDEAARLHLHRVWQRLAEERGWDYRREPLTP